MILLKIIFFKILPFFICYNIFFKQNWQEFGYCCTISFMNIVIRAGGPGSRLWPLSRQNRPKQFIKLLGGLTMLENTLDRIGDLAPLSSVFISTRADLVEDLQKILPDFPLSNILSEPSTRNTGPAMCLEVCYLLKILGEDEIIASIPSDDYIGNPAAWRDILSSAAEHLKKNPDDIITPAVKPEYPEIGYSYLCSGGVLNKEGETQIHKVGGMVEKPDYEKCLELIGTGDYFWHTGMYVWRLGRIAELFKKEQPAMYEACSLLVSGEEKSRAESLYAQLSPISVESAITNKVESLVMTVSDNLLWSDVGTWPAVKRVLGSDNKDNTVLAKLITGQAKNNLVISQNPEKLIVLEGVENLAVIDTEDALLVCDLDKSPALKEVIDRIKKDPSLDGYL